MGLGDMSRATALASAGMAFALNCASFLLIGNTSALTLQLAGVVKDWLLIVMSAAVFRHALTPLNLGGYGVAFAGAYPGELGGAAALPPAHAAWGGRCEWVVACDRHWESDIAIIWLQCIVGMYRLMCAAAACAGVCYYNLSKTREAQKREEKGGLAEALLSPSRSRPAPASAAEAGSDEAQHMPVLLQAQQNGHVL